MTADPDDPGEAPACCAPAAACVFEKALLARTASCELGCRRGYGEREVIFCNSPVAQTNCRLLLALFRERATFVLKLPRGAAPVIHAKALRLQCGGLEGLRQALIDGGAPCDGDVHRMAAQAHATWGSFTELPWPTIVQMISQWVSRRRRLPR